MNGWWSLLDGDGPQAFAERLYGAWMRLGRHQLVELDYRTSSPAVIGRAILAVIQRRPDWEGQAAPDDPRQPLPRGARPAGARGCRRAGCRRGPRPVTHREVTAASAAADLLFLTLPTRVDGSPGGRISAKTYEYLTTDRPILAATPAGENRDYLERRAGVWLVDPTDEQGMARVIEDLAAAKFSGALRAPSTARRCAMSSPMTPAHANSMRWFATRSRRVGQTKGP